VEPGLGGACGAVGRKSLLLLFVDHVRWSGSQRRPCMLDGGRHLTEMDVRMEFSVLLS
jgi:hypothetical protein